jgi:hypothetical protein
VDLPAQSNQVTTDSFLAPGYSGPLFLGLIAIRLMLFHDIVGHILEGYFYVANRLSGKPLY